MLPPGGEDNQGGGRISRDRLPPGHLSMVGLPPGGATCPGGKINWDTGVVSDKSFAVGRWVGR